MASVFFVYENAKKLSDQVGYDLMDKFRTSAHKDTPTLTLIGEFNSFAVCGDLDGLKPLSFRAKEVFFELSHRAQAAEKHLLEINHAFKHGQAA